MSEGFTYYIDVVSSCNLRCPSCPQGNMSHVENPSGFMDAELLNAIIKKAVAEGHISTVGLFNWTEPFLHPHLPRLIEIVNSHGVPCGLSTNLNLPAPLHDIMKAQPVSIIVSVSGFTQSVYGRTHRSGRIDLVKTRMVELARAREETGAKTEIILAYHRYLGNLDEECLMRRYAEELGFLFRPTWALLMPLEKVMAAISEHPLSSKLTVDDVNLIQSLALPLNEAMDLSKKERKTSCPLRDNQMTLTARGSVMLCCAVFDSNQHIVGNYLSDSFEDLQSRKMRHQTCKQCMEAGIHVYGNGHPEFDRLATKHLTRYYAKTGVDFESAFAGPSLTCGKETGSVVSGTPPEQLRHRYALLAGLSRALNRISSRFTI